MSRRIVWAPAARRDMRQIWDYIALDSARYATAMLRRIVNGVSPAA